MAKYSQLARTLTLNKSSGSTVSSARSGLNSSTKSSLKSAVDARIAELIALNNGIELPGFYQQAADEVLGDYLGDDAINEKYWETVTKGKELQVKIDEVKNDLDEIDTQFQEAMKQATETYKNNPDNLTSSIASLYLQYERQLDDIKTERLKNNQEISDVVQKQTEISSVASEMSGLVISKSMGLETTSANTNLVWTIDSDPDTGKIIDMNLVPLSSIKPETGFKLTNSNYNGFNVYGKEYTDQTGATKLKVGNSSYTLQEDVEGNTVYKKIETVPGIWSGTRDIVQENVNDIDLSDSQFINSFEMPINSVVKDARGNLYWQGNDGWYQAEDENKLMNFTGKTIEEITAAPTVSLGMIGTMNGLYTNEGTTRMINDELLGKTPIRSVSVPNASESIRRSPASISPSLTTERVMKDITARGQQQASQIPRKTAAMQNKPEEQSTFDRAKTIFSGLFGGQ